MAIEKMEACRSKLEGCEWVTLLYNQSLRLHSQQVKLERTANQLNVVQSENTKIRSNLQIETTKVNQLRTDNSSLTIKATENRNELINQTTELNQLVSELTKRTEYYQCKERNSAVKMVRIQSENVALLTAITTGKAEIDTLQTDRDELRAERAEHRTTKKVTDSSILQLYRTKDKLTTELAKTQKYAQKLKAEVSYLSLDASYLEATNESLKNQNEKLESNQKQLLQYLISLDKRSITTSETLEKVAVQFLGITPGTELRWKMAWPTESNKSSMSPGTARWTNYYLKSNYLKTVGTTLYIRSLFNSKNDKTSSNYGICFHLDIDGIFGQKARIDASWEVKIIQSGNTLYTIAYDQIIRGSFSEWSNWIENVDPSAEFECVAVFSKWNLKSK